MRLHFLKSPVHQEQLVVMLGALLLTLVLLTRTELLTVGSPDFAAPMDHHKYIRMAAEGILDFHIAPYAWRVGVPLLARWLPFDLQTSFLLITLVSLWLTGVAVYLLGRAHRFDPPVAAFGVLLFYSLGWAAKFPLYDFWLPDALSFLLITLAIWAILTRRDPLFFALLTLGVLVKESVLFVAPLYYTLRATRPIDLRLAGRTALLAAPAVLALISLRLAIPQMNDNVDYLATLPLELRLVRYWDGTGGFFSTYYDYGWMLREIGLRRLATITPEIALSWTFGTFGVVGLVLPLLDVRWSARLLLRYLPFVVLVYSTLLFVGTSERNLVVAFPAIIPLALIGVETISRRVGARGGTVKETGITTKVVTTAVLWGLPLLMFGLHLSRRRGGFSEPVLIEAAITALYLAVIFIGRRWVDLKGLRTPLGSGSGVSLLLILALAGLLLPYLAYTVVRIGSPAPISYNDGWNVIHAARVDEGKALYLPVEPALPTTPVNYLPTSFYLTAWLTPPRGSYLLTGRLITLLSFFAVGGLIFASIRTLTGQRWAALLGALVWLALVTFTANNYTGVYDPQMAGHALATAALYWYLRRVDLTPWPPLLSGEGEPEIGARPVVLAALSVLALSFKHILIAAPLTIAVGLWRIRRRAFWVYVAAGVVSALALLSVSRLVGGEHLVANLVDLNRNVSWYKLVRDTGNLYVSEAAGLALLPLFVLALHTRRWWPVYVYAGLALLVGLFAVRGIGVNRNAWFDLYIAAALGSGLLAAELKGLTRWKRGLAHLALAAILLPLALRLPQAPSLLNLDALGQDAAYTRDITLLPQALPGLLNLQPLRRLETLYAQDVALLRSMPEPVLVEELLMIHDAGKTMLFDPFNGSQMLIAGRVPESVLLDPIRRREFSVIVTKFDVTSRARRLRAAYRDPLPPQTTEVERWTDNTLLAIDEHYQLLDPGRSRYHYFYVPR